MKIQANAKINLTLDICSKRSDGYHIINSVMQSVSLADLVEIKKSDSISVCYSDIGKTGENDICFIAAVKFFEYSKIIGGTQIEVDKKIPCVAGVGGSSSDAAAVIHGLNRLYNTNYSDNELCKIALKVGADVPFCIVGGSCLVSGIGETVTPIVSIPDCAFLIVVLGKKQSTKQMYDDLDSRPLECPKTEKMLEIWQQGDLKKISSNLSNAFEALYDITYEKELLSSFSPLGISLSGSGPAVYAIFENADKALKAQSQLLKEKIVSYVAMPQKNGVKFE
ncbi:MAG: 4-(cytidine 5'-diphospho)-2-C-methyl-D-erythritol kinase [Clostridia bacterium]|nr:4-(cytidine 5'-diphospho)-2-C-methyl-D-erythritol kinase [Clostridia bacterium]